MPRIRALGIDKQENMRAGAIMIACGEAAGRFSFRLSMTFSQLIQKVLAPLAYGGADVDLVTGTDTSHTHYPVGDIHLGQPG